VRRAHLAGDTIVRFVSQTGSKDADRHDHDHF
jgi:hypothetical protein